MEHEQLHLSSKQEQAELLHQVLSSNDEDCREETLIPDPDGFAAPGTGAAGRTGSHFDRRSGAKMSSLSGADDTVFVDTSSAAVRARLAGAKERHPLFKLFRR